MASIALKIPTLRDVPERCEGCPIRHQAVCSKCGPEELAELDKIKFYRDYDPGQEIVAAGEETAILGSVVSGVVSLSKTMDDGRRQMVGLLFASDFVGRPMRNTAPYDAIAVTPVRMCLFQRGRFEQVLTGSPHLESRLLEMTLDELDAAREWMLLLGRKTARERISHFLLILLRRAAALDKVEAEDGVSCILPLTREAIAEYLGLTIETVSRQISALRKAGVIEIRDQRQVIAVDLQALIEASGTDD